MMKSQYVILTCLVFALAGNASAQTMRWIPVTGKTGGQGCPPAVTKERTQCYALEYTPVHSGVLTSYTTGFFVSCTSIGAPVLSNQSCSMQNNAKLTNACETHGMSLLNSSGNSGASGQNTIKADVPVILHQVCFDVPPGEEIVISEDETTDLTTSIQVQGNAVTEFPKFETFTIRRPKAQSTTRPGKDGRTENLDAGDASIATRDAEIRDLDVEVSPNPARDILRIHAIGGSDSAVLKCIDLHGKVVLLEEIETLVPTYSMDISVLTSGVYQLVVESGTQSVTKSFAVVD